jgi:hypothetical protein
MDVNSQGIQVSHTIEEFTHRQQNQQERASSTIRFYSDNNQNRFNQCMERIVNQLRREQKAKESDQQED